MVPASSGLSRSVWQSTKAGFCITTQAALYAGELACILPSAENSSGLSRAYTTDSCQQHCPGQTRGEVRFLSDAALLAQPRGSACLCWGSHPSSSLGVTRAGLLWARLCRSGPAHCAAFCEVTRVFLCCWSTSGKLVAVNF